jgi:hypothetical protein
MSKTMRRPVPLSAGSAVSLSVVLSGGVYDGGPLGVLGAGASRRATSSMAPPLRDAAPAAYDGEPPAGRRPVPPRTAVPVTTTAAENAAMRP